MDRFAFVLMGAALSMGTMLIAFGQFAWGVLLVLGLTFILVGSRLLEERMRQQFWARPVADDEGYAEDAAEED